MTQHHHDSEHPLWDNLSAEFGEQLEAEARLIGPGRAAALDLVADHLDAEPRLILDLGSGTGADAVALARRFPMAEIHALDISTELLSRVRARAERADVGSRVIGRRVDLDGDWTDSVPPGADVVWAALSLHHVNDPARTLRRAFASLRPGGALVLTELAGIDELSLGDLKSARPELHERINAASHNAGHRFLDWAALLADAGFGAVEHRAVDITVRTLDGEGAEYLQRRIHGVREQLAGTLAEQDLGALDSAIEGAASGTASAALRERRAVRVAFRPKADGPSGRPVRTDCDVAVVGGGAAGLAAAIVLARSRRSVVVIDEGRPRNAPAAGAHNVLGNEGVSPLELLATGRKEAKDYGVEIIAGRVTRISGDLDDFTLAVEGADSVGARRIILATGLVDDLPAVPGVLAGWGKSVLHCPFCHGWEVRGKRIGILARNDAAVHQAMLFRQLSDQVTVFLDHAFDPTEEQWEQLAALGVRVVDAKVERLVMEGERVRGVEIGGGRTFAADAVVVAPRFNARTTLFESLGGTGESTPFGIQIPTDPRGLTPVPGVWAVGNGAQPMSMVMASAASGVATGSAVHGDLAMSDLDRAVSARRVVTAGRD